MLFEIKTWTDGSVLFSLETGTLNWCVQAAVRAGVYLCAADLCGADLRGANLRGANLRAADLCGADLRAADLSGADLYAASLRAADLRATCFRGANLCGADLRVAYLCAAEFSGANLRGAKGWEKSPIQIAGHKNYMMTTQDGSLQIGCKVHSFENWKKIAKEVGGENGYSDLDVEIYKLHIEHVEKVSRLLWKKESK